MYTILAFLSAIGLIVSLLHPLLYLFLLLKDITSGHSLIILIQVRLICLFQLTFPPWNPGPAKTIFIGPPPVLPPSGNTTMTTTPTTTSAMETEKIYKSSVGGGDVDDKVIGKYKC